MTQEAWQLLLSLQVDWQGEKNEEVEEEAGLLWIRTTSVMVGGKGWLFPLWKTPSHNHALLCFEDVIFNHFLN